MHNQANFGNLTLKRKKLYNLQEILKKDDFEIDVLFSNSMNKLEEMTVIEAERKEALENLRILTSILQTKRLRNKAKSCNKYFTL